MELGYKPWKTVGGVSLRDHHQTCTRVLRADYCGNGVSHTQDGTLINIWDTLPAPGPIQQRAVLPPPGMRFEAGWDTLCDVIWTVEAPPEVAIARLLADGTLDTEFTDTGVMTIDFFGFTDLAESVRRAEIVFIAVGTPQGEDGSADLTHVLQVAREVARARPP